jgi:hypothetical protein
MLSWKPRESIEEVDQIESMLTADWRLAGNTFIIPCPSKRRCGPLKLARIDSHVNQGAILTLHISFINSCLAGGRSRAAKGHRMIWLAGGALEWHEAFPESISRNEPQQTLLRPTFTLCKRDAQVNDLGDAEGCHFQCTCREVRCTHRGQILSYPFPTGKSMLSRSQLLFGLLASTNPSMLLDMLRLRRHVLLVVLLNFA